MPGKNNVMHRSRTLSDNDELCVEWLGFRHGGLVTKEDAMFISDVDEFLVERVGHEHAGWRIQPSADKVQRMRELHERSFLDAA
ncbi:hypothetical protein [Mesorhizobium sp. Cs1299R1N3]|uniref:hypothetical protein n=1 Tax=Mesorhizobium sp. Cs1299R1N3 TaxID=3015173 RepID=UPI00301C7AA0